ncbi:MAG: UDP-N-acetylglucosamine 1-carboxyvinyltransferase [Clostridiales bacterium]|nr:UDP-N-acetylglucosamine 1-carboxyvinyltransferase [Clostridiales bacterium]
MEKLIINGSRPLNGTVKASGAKNAALGIMAATVIANGPCLIGNLPEIEDVEIMKDIIHSLGVKVKSKKNQAYFDASTMTTSDVETPLASKMRASYYLIGALLAKTGRASIPLPGGCQIGARPIDQHIKGFKALGATVDISENRISVSARKLVGDEIYFDSVSVGATINVMLAAVRAEGTTKLVNAAREPHVVDTANFLNLLGASIRGAGTDVITIEGVSELKGGEYSIIPDQIEIGTYMIAAAATNGNVYITDVIPKHMETLSAKLEDMGVTVENGDDYIHVVGNGRPYAVNVKTSVYPGFPTDLQQPLSALLCIAQGNSTVTENIFENRFRHLEELKKMGASVETEGRRAFITGVSSLTGAKIMASDLRAGAALVIAGLMAEGETEVYGLEHIDRGYESIEKKFSKLGADIKRVPYLTRSGS